jgi:hypothetical protein
MNMPLGSHLGALQGLRTGFLDHMRGLTLMGSNSRIMILTSERQGIQQQQQRRPLHQIVSGPAKLAGNSLILVVAFDRVLPDFGTAEGG